MVGILVLVKVNPERILVHQWHWYSSTAWYSYMFYTMRNMHKEHHALQSHFLIANNLLLLSPDLLLPFL